LQGVQRSADYFLKNVGHVSNVTVTLQA